MLENSTLILGIVAVSLLINLITMILVIKSTKKNKTETVKGNTFEQSAAAESAVTVHSTSEIKSPAQATGIIFCRKCGKQYDTTQTACPSCKAAR